MLKLILIVSVLVSSAHSTAGLRVASYNIRNFDYDVRSHTPTNKLHLVKMINEMQADIIAVQEINEKEEFKNMITKNFAGSYKAKLSECGGANDQKLGFIYNTNKLSLLEFKEDLRTVNPNYNNQNQEQEQGLCYTGSRPLAIGIFKNNTTNEKIVAIAVHLKAGGRPSNIRKRFKQHKVISTIVNEFHKNGFMNVIVMGDFNSTEYIYKGEEFERFKESVQAMDMADAAKDLKCSAYWWGGSRDSKQHPSALDHILISNNLLNGTTPKLHSYGHCKKLNCKTTLEENMGVSFDEVSDHCPILAEIE
jgi:endonuclease/exonuclease/phosphatase family metal-dependent hydrolase